MRATPQNSAAATETTPVTLPAGGAYVDGERVDGPVPEYGWVMNDVGERVRAPGPKE